MSLPIPLEVSSAGIEAAINLMKDEQPEKPFDEKAAFDNITKQIQPKMKTYVQRTGRMYGDDGKLLFTGYSGGNKGKNPEGINNPDMQHLRNIGPIPCGYYEIGEPFTSHVTGTHAMRLTPDPSNEMFGRGDLECHGDNPPMNRSASDGCIVHSPASERCQIYTKGEKRLRVVEEESDVNSPSMAEAPPVLDDAPEAPETEPVTA